MNQHYDAVVVGGGCGGTYAAWQMQTQPVSGFSPLAQDPSQRSIALFELSDRIGGRLESIVPPGMTSLYAEFGGFGFTSKDVTLNAVIKELTLAVSPFKGSTGANLFYLRGQRFTVTDAHNPQFTPPYALEPSDKGVDPRAFVPAVIAKVFPGSENWDEAKWQQATSGSYNGRSFSDTGFWNFLLDNMTNEELSYARDATGHFFEVANWNCAQALPWYALDGNATYSTLTDGYDVLPKTMASEFVRGGGQLLTNTGVASIEQFTSGPQGQTTIEITTTDGQTCTADIVVLALPRRSLELISSNLLADPSVQALIGSVTGQPVLKIWCCYDQAWWSSLGITQGSSATDLPLGQCWYFGPDPETGKALLLGAYDDTLGPTYWEGLSIGARFPSGPNPDPQWAAQAVGADLIGALQTQLAELHGIDDLPEPYAAAWMDWSQDPYGGAFNTWNVGVDAVGVAKAILQPNEGVPLYVCGEAYSLVDQGWVEGALETAQSVLGLLGVQAPASLTANAS